MKVIFKKRVKKCSLQFFLCLRKQGTEQTDDDKSQWMLSGLVELCEESSNNLLLCRLLALPPSNHFSGELCEERLSEKQAASAAHEKYFSCKNISKCGH